ncbi:MAG: acylneuraminate cytidylyltransferase, partial [Bifidobacteriaceae bacterium]|nr:acylneuraminate cytidylyltransferase [Bifidobacteriaceae bacterium]
MTAPCNGAPALAIIPARGGSTGVPGKNLRRVGGVSLIGRTIRAMHLAGIARIVVTTDSADIVAAAQEAGAETVIRPAHLATGSATSEAALLHALDVLETTGPPLPGVLVFAQATSPFVDPAAVRAAIGKVATGGADSVFSAARSHTFTWTRTEPGQDNSGAGPAAEATVQATELKPLGHPADRRPRRQDLAPRYAETGAFYVMDTAGFRQAGFRFFGRLDVQEVAPETAIEIDAPADLVTARALAPLIDPVLAPEPLDIDALAMDFDGVHTDNTALLALDGSESVRVHRGDGSGIAALRAIGLPMIILTRERTPPAAVRGQKLQLPVQLGVQDKAANLSAWLSDLGIDPARAAYLGNDLIDLPAMTVVGWPLAVADSVPEVLAAARLVTAA